jgi:tRNA-(ms[2]io[6]A)-hydroxylase
MAKLASATDAAWLERVLPHVDELLVEQAHLEKKAASGALTYLFRYPEHVVLLAPLSELAREELGHFERVLALLERRGIPFRRLRPGPYASELLAAVRDTEPERLLDQLLCHAAIEARSCERMRLLARALAGRDDELATLYGDLVRSEARHQSLYVELAARLFPRATVDARQREILSHESAVLARPCELPRLHG